MKILTIIGIVLIALSTSFAQSEIDIILFDFNSAKTTGNWYTVNDDVMGGASKSTLEIKKGGVANFSGILSPDNYGGFASMRALVSINSENNFRGVIVRVKGDGKKYSIRFRTSTDFDGYAYESKFTTDVNAWKEIKILFSDFKPTFRGQTLSNKPKLESKNIEQIGLLIADKQFGKFNINIDWIKLF